MAQAKKRIKRFVDVASEENLASMLSWITEKTFVVGSSREVRARMEQLQTEWEEWS